MKSWKCNIFEAKHLATDKHGFTLTKINQIIRFGFAELASEKFIGDYLC